MAVCGTLRLPYLWFSSGANTSAGQILQLSSKTHTFGHFEIYPVVSKSINNKTHCQWHFGSMTWFEPKCKRCLMIKFEPPLFPRYFIKISISTCRSNQRPSPSSSFKDDIIIPNPLQPINFYHGPKTPEAIQILDFWTFVRRLCTSVPTWPPTPFWQLQLWLWD